MSTSDHSLPCQGGASGGGGAAVVSSRNDIGCGSNNNSSSDGDGVEGVGGSGGGENSSASSSLTRESIDIVLESIDHPESIYDEKLVMQMIADGGPGISCAEGKDVCLVIGSKGAGKSTTINFLRGFEMVKLQGGMLDVNETDKSRTAAIGHTPDYCTKLPTAYESLLNPSTVFIDTKGFDMFESLPEETLAASILVEMAVSRARSVKIMCVVDYGSLDVGRAESFANLGRILEKIVIGHEIPVLFVLNRVIVREEQSSFFEAPYDEVAAKIKSMSKG